MGDGSTRTGECASHNTWVYERSGEGIGLHETNKLGVPPVTHDGVIKGLVMSSCGFV